jgi:hypothetical protein
MPQHHIMTADIFHIALCPSVQTIFVYQEIKTRIKSKEFGDLKKKWWRIREYLDSSDSTSEDQDQLLDRLIQSTLLEEGNDEQDSWWTKFWKGSRKDEWSDEGDTSRRQASGIHALNDLEFLQASRTLLESYPRLVGFTERITTCLRRYLLDFEADFVKRNFDQALQLEEQHRLSSVQATVNNRYQELKDGLCSSLLSGLRGAMQRSGQ